MACYGVVIDGRDVWLTWEEARELRDKLLAQFPLEKTYRVEEDTYRTMGTWNVIKTEIGPIEEVFAHCRTKADAEEVAAAMVKK